MNVNKNYLIIVSSPFFKRNTLSGDGRPSNEVNFACKQKLIEIHWTDCLKTVT